MTDQENDKKINKRNPNLLQNIYYIFIILGTLFGIGFAFYNTYISSRQSNLIFRPILGITDIQQVRLLNDTTLKDANELNSYQNFAGLQIFFIIENVGNLPAKNVHITSTGTLGDTTLPSTLDKKSGPILVPKTRVVNLNTISKNDIDRLFNKEKLILTIKIEYSDWYNIHSDSYESYFEVEPLSKEPFLTRINPLGSNLLSQK
jgi:hypothetical protein